MTVTVKKGEKDYNVKTISKMFFTIGHGLQISILLDHLQGEIISENKCQFYAILFSDFVIALKF